MSITRRHLLELVVASPLLAAGGCCRTRYPQPRGSLAGLSARAIMGPSGRRPGAGLTTRVIDVHAHFFNAADVPVRGFVEDCLGHRANPVVRQFLKAIAKIADRLADAAPAAHEELDELRALVTETSGLGLEAARAQVPPRLASAREDAARRTADVIRGTDVERLYRQYKPRPQARVGGATSPAITPGEVAALADEAETPARSGARAGARSTAAQPDADIADGMLGFLKYMLSSRWANVQAYKGAYSDHENAFGIDTVFGCLVDFDYWLDCPPRSAQGDQVLVHKLLQDLHGQYFRAVVAYNPWTDLNQDGAGLARVVQACTEYGFAAVKIYPPIGFTPADNAVNPPETRKSRPDLAALDRTLTAFFARCAELRIPVIAHTARSNGRDDAHDEFGGPQGWERLLTQYAADARTPVIDFGHFGGTAWTQEFAELIGREQRVALYGDLGYWDELVCSGGPDEACRETRERLQQAMRVSIGTSGARVADRTMFATDWLMLSQMKRWADYPATLHESLQAIASDDEIARVFGGNAVTCFRL